MSTPRMPRRELPDPYAVKIVLDSIAPSGARLTTFALTYPRFVHAELMTHRVFSRNSASSRAIPNEKLRALVAEHPALPIFWGKNQSGMQAREELSDGAEAAKALRQQADEKWAQSDKASSTALHERARLVKASSPRALVQKKWLEARDSALKFSAELAEMGLHKQLCNRLIEPWMPITVLVSATEYDNWFHLRDHKDAQPEIQVIATEMHYQYLESKPQRLEPDEWHMPYIRAEDLIDAAELLRASVGTPTQGDGSAFMASLKETLCKVSVGRCARVSYLTHEGVRDLSKDIELHDKLAATAEGGDPGHFSPFEHVAQVPASGRLVQSGNFTGWFQYRKEFVGEAGPRA